MVLFLFLMAASAPVINEVCYDPAGTDGGAEFVELFNPGDGAVSLAGARLEFANGAEEPRWRLRWTGAADDAIAARSWFLIADEGWQGPPAHAQVTLALQNGPDAVRLVRADGTTDIVGWGDLDWPELSEGTPAADVSGESLARRPDGADSGNNDADFVGAASTPGAANFPAFAPRLTGVRWEPPILAAPGVVTATVTLVNEGLDDLGGTVARLRLGNGAAGAVLPSTAPESTAVLQVMLAADEVGCLPAGLDLRGAAAADSVSLDLGRFQVGPAAWRLGEVMAAPIAGGEWCEIVHAGSVSRSLAELALRDEDGSWRSLPDVVLAPGDRQVVAQNADILAAWLDELSAAGATQTCRPRAPVTLAGWPSLNNTAPPERPFADRVYLGATDGTVFDYVTVGLGSGRAPAGRSFERFADGSWRPATAPGGATPGCPPLSAPPATAGGLELAPNPFSTDDGDGALHLSLDVPDGAGGWELRLYDLWGRRVRDLGGDDLGPGPRETVWDGVDDDGRPLPAGGYVAVLHWRMPGGGLTAAARRLVVIREARP